MKKPHTKGVDESHEGVQDKGIPALVGVVEERVDRVSDQERKGNPPKIPEGLLIVFLGLLLVGLPLLETNVGEA